MNNILSQVIFGVGIVLAISALAAIFINSVSLENANLQSSATSQTTIQPVSPNENGTTPTQSSSKTNNIITEIKFFIDIIKPIVLDIEAPLTLTINL